MREWISVEDRKVDITTYTLQLIGEPTSGSAHDPGYTGRVVAVEPNYCLVNVSHWMPLPEPPK